MSKLSDNIRSVLQECFPQAKIIEEYYIKFKNRKLFFDFYMPQYNILVEVQGIQHYNYIDHFHGSIENFKDYKKRDNLKIEYALQSDNVLVIVDYNEDITKDVLLKKIIGAQNDRYYN